MKFKLLMTLMVIGGCTVNPGVVQVAKNEYLVTRTAYGDTWSSGHQVLAGLYLDAAEKCGGHDRVRKIEEHNLPGQVFVRNATATLRFMCSE